MIKHFLPREKIYTINKGNTRKFWSGFKKQNRTIQLIEPWTRLYYGFGF